MITSVISSKVTLILFEKKTPSESRDSSDTKDIDYISLSLRLIAIIFRIFAQCVVLSTNTTLYWVYKYDIFLYPTITTLAF